MKRALFIAIPLTLTVVIVAIIAFSLLGTPVAAKQELDNYLKFQHSTATVQAFIRANRPWNLTADLNYPVLGDSWYFQTDQAYGFMPTPRPSHLQALVPEKEDTNTAVPSLSLAGGVPLPYPPEEVWCVLLDEIDHQQILFVARHHEEPHGIDWVVHQGPSTPFDPDFSTTLQEIGCQLDQDF